MDVNKGDCLWTMSKQFLYGSAIPYIPETPSGALTNKPLPRENEFLAFLVNLPWWAWLLLLFFTFCLFMTIRESVKNSERRKEWKLDPIRSGEPFNPNGVSSSEAHTRMEEIIRNQYPGATFAIKSMRRGVLNGQAIVWYKGKPTPQERIFDSVAGYEAVTEINGREETVYCLQGCGNPIRVGDFFKAGAEFSFTPDAVINEDGSEIPIVVEEELVEIKPETEEGPKPPEVVGSELYRIASTHAVLAEDLLKANSAHRITLRITTPGGSVETVIEVKNDAKTKKSDEEKKG